MNISVLSIGTELTSGQIHNKHGQWISSQLRDLGVPTSMHLVVPDDEALILQSLKFCSEHSEVIFVTGGLGPTSDDFTRDVIAKWTTRKLTWDESSWKHIEERLVPRGYSVKPIQKQQCYFPEGSKILLNREGTANAFYLRHEDKDIYVLPGPPREIASVWQDYIHNEMSERARHVDPLITQSWDTIGVGESDVANLVEDALKDCPFEKGYRVHVPFVEFKITYLKSQSSEAQKWTAAIENAISPITVLRNGEDAAEKLGHSLNEFPQVVICDEIPGSFLLNRLFPFSKRLLKFKKLNFVNSLENVPSDFSSLLLHLKEDSAGHGRASLTWRGQTKSQIFMSPYKSSLLQEREQQFYAEMALIYWMKEVSHGPAVSSTPSSPQGTLR